MNKIGIIVGTGYKLEGKTKKKNIGNVDVYIQKISGNDVYVIYRHGIKHDKQPSDVNYYGNIMALYKLGVDLIIGTTAVGSLKEELNPGDIVIPNQFIDWTKSRRNTIFIEQVKHTPMSEPFSKEINQILFNIAKENEFNCHLNRTIITIEGQRFSTKAESKMFQMIGADVINMTTCPEVIFANELEIPYSTIAMVTDYDCWKEETVTYEKINEVMENNKNKLDVIIKKLLYVL